MKMATELCSVIQTILLVHGTSTTEVMLNYVKWRSLIQCLQASLEKLGPLKGIDISLVGRNLWIIDKNMEFSDPEETLSSGNSTNGYQSGAYPAVKTYGFNFKFNF